MKIAENTVVSMEYTLTDEAGQVLDQSAGREPLSYVHGRQEIVPGLERALAGKSPGDEFSVTVSPEEGYGVVDEGLLFEVPRTQLPPDLKPEQGMQLLVDGPSGPTPVVLTEVKADSVVMDANHPLAGKALTFAIEVKSVGEAEKPQKDCCSSGSCGS